MPALFSKRRATPCAHGFQEVTTPCAQLATQQRELPTARTPRAGVLVHSPRAVDYACARLCADQAKSSVITSNVGGPPLEMDAACWSASFPRVEPAHS